MQEWQEPVSVRLTDVHYRCDFMEKDQMQGELAMLVNSVVRKKASGGNVGTS